MVASGNFAYCPSPQFQRAAKICIQICTELLTIVWFCDLSECNVANMLTERIHTKRYNDIVWLKSHFTSTARMLRWLFFSSFLPIPFFLPYSTHFLFSHLCHSSTWWFDCRITFTIVNCEALLAVCACVCVCLNFISKRIMGNYLYIEFWWIAMYFMVWIQSKSHFGYISSVNSIVSIHYLQQFKANSIIKSVGMNIQV